MSNIAVDYDVLNQKQTPAFYASSLATRPAAGYPGRIFIDTDTPSSGIYRDTGTSWEAIADPGAGTTGTLQQVTTNGNTTTLGIQVQNIDINDGAGTGTGNVVFGNSSLQGNTTGFNNTAIGNNSLVNNTTGSSNTSVGRSNLQSNTTGSSNTSVGSNALQLNTTGSSNTAIGNNALNANTTGYINVALGYTALQNNTIGFANIGIGQQTLLNNTTGNANVGVGNAVLSGNVTGSNNTAIGNGALSTSGAASNNTAVGSSSLLSNTTGTNNTAVGYNSMLLNTTGNANTAVGNDALNANTTGTNNTAIGYFSLYYNTASNNTAIGRSSLQSNTTGSSNTAIGLNSLNNNTTGEYNIAIGVNSLLANTTGIDNTAIGSQALQSNTTGNLNTSIGFSSLQNNSTGANNTSIGSNALLNNTTASNNTAIGFNSLRANTTGGNNVAIGFESLKANTTADNNTAIGTNTLNLNTTGSGNTAIGTSALTSATTGGQNTAIGINAGSNISTGTNNSFLGISAGVGITTGSNNTIIGNAGTLSATLTSNIILADGGGNTRLFSDANGLIAINQAVGSVPGGQLDIHTTQTYALVLNGLTTNNAYTAFSNNSVGKWRIGNTYNAGANTFDIFNLTSSTTALSFNSTTNVATFSFPVTATGVGSNTILAGTGLKVTSSNAGLYLNFSPSFTGGVEGEIASSENGLRIVAAGSGVNTMRFLTSNASGVSTFAMAINGSQNVGIGTLTPTNTAGFSRQLQIEGTYPALTLNNTTGTSSKWSLGAGSAGDFGIWNNGTSSYAMYIPSTNNILINTGTDDTINKLQVTGSASISTYLNGLGLRAIGSSAFGGTGVGVEIGYSGGLGYVQAYNRSTSAYQPIKLDGSTIALQNNGVQWLGISGGTVNMTSLAGTGSRAVLADATGNLSAPVSDISVKENIITIGYGLNEILKMKPVWFDFIDEYKNYGEGRQNGNIAQEMEAIIPEAVFTTPSTGKMGINYDQLHAVYIKAIQELNKKLDKLYINHYGQ